MFEIKFDREREAGMKKSRRRKTGGGVYMEGGLERSSREMVILWLRVKRKRGNERDQNKSRKDQVEDKERWEVRENVKVDGC